MTNSEVIFAMKNMNPKNFYGETCRSMTEISSFPPHFRREKMTSLDDAKYYYQSGSSEEGFFDQDIDNHKSEYMNIRKTDVMKTDVETLGAKMQSLPYLEDMER